MSELTLPAVSDDDAQRLASVAQQLAGRVRDDHPDAVARWLCTVLDGVDRWRLIFLLAAMIPADQTAGQLLAWYQDQQRQNVARRIVDEIYGGAA